MRLLSVAIGRRRLEPFEAGQAVLVGGAAHAGPSLGASEEDDVVAELPEDQLQRVAWRGGDVGVHECACGVESTTTVCVLCDDR